jgi:hypothetical protein
VWWVEKVWEKLRVHRTVLTLEMDLVSTRDVKRQVGALTALKSAEWFDAHCLEEVEPVCASLEAFTQRHLAHLEATVRAPLRHPKVTKVRHSKLNVTRN